MRSFIIPLMPSHLTHLAIAKRYLEKHAQMIKNAQRFIDGNVAPDLVSDKAKSHYGNRTERHNIVKYNAEKVNPRKFLQTHDLSDDYNKGQYLHLCVDYEFYNHFFLEYFQHAVSGWQVGVDFYETTRRDDVYLCQKYGISYEDATMAHELRVSNEIWDDENVEKRRRPDYKYSYLYEFEQLDEFIEKMSDIAIPLG